MSKTRLPSILPCAVLAATASFGELKISVGEKLPAWAFQDAEKQEFTMDSWEGKVLHINFAG